MQVFFMQTVSQADFNHLYAHILDIAIFSVATQIKLGILLLEYCRTFNFGAFIISSMSHYMHTCTFIEN